MDGRRPLRHRRPSGARRRAATDAAGDGINLQRAHASRATRPGIIAVADTMRAVVIERIGPPDVLAATTLPTPAPGPGEVLVAVQAAAVNAIDWKTRAGRGVLLGGFPAVLGWDVSGEVVAQGPVANRFAPGEPVFGMLRFPQLAGTYAEFVTAPEAQLAPRPSDLSPVAAAGTMCALTAWESLFDHGGLRAGQRVLIHGGAGGVGHVAVELARSVDAEVIATASPRNVDFLLDLGAAAVVDYGSTDLEQAATDVDLVLDTRGGQDFHRLLPTLRPGGTIVTLLGETPDQRTAAAARDVRVAHTYVAPHEARLAKLGAAIGDGRVRLNIDATFTLDQAAEAHELGEQGHVRGLLALTID
jgi:NADPH:quinone reductase-like Zn-dependent oxidoreductase